MTPEEQAARSIERAVCHLLAPPSGKGTPQPFFASLAMELERKAVGQDWFDRQGLPGNYTAATDGLKLYYYPPFINSLTDSLLKSLLLHEIWHVSNGHCWRRGNRHGLLWNVAADYVVNALVKHECQSKIGPDWLYKDEYKGQSAEEVYAKLEKQCQKKGGKPGDGSGGGQPGSVIDASSSGADPVVVEKLWEQKIIKASQMSRGNVPAQFAHLIESLLNPKVPWTVYLRRFVQTICRSDYNWSRPNRKYNWQGIILPSLHANRVGHLAFAIDTSGSTAEHWQQFKSESQAVLDEVQPEKLSYFENDAAIAARYDYQPGDTIELKVHGGGGSDTRPVFDALALDPEPPLCCVYLTDGYIEYPDVAPPYPVLWIISNDQQTPPWGEVARL